MSSSSRAQQWLDRLAAVESRLVRLTAQHLQGLTAPDEATGEKWEAGQAWAHLAEFGAYWLDELEHVLRAEAWPAPFGRVKTDAVRLRAIEDGRHAPVLDHVEAVRSSIARLRERLQSMTDDDWTRVGLHQTLGEMDIDAQLQHFHVGHYEEHADQLDSLAP